MAPKIAQQTNVNVVNGLKKRNWWKLLWLPKKMTGRSIKGRVSLLRLAFCCSCFFCRTIAIGPNQRNSRLRSEPFYQTKKSVASAFVVNQIGNFKLHKIELDIIIHIMLWLILGINIIQGGQPKQNTKSRGKSQKNIFFLPCKTGSFESQDHEKNITSCVLLWRLVLLMFRDIPAEIARVFLG